MATTPDTNVSKPSRDQINAFRTDMFGRTKVSEPFTLFDSTHRYTQNGDFSDVVGGTASSSHIEYQSTAALTVGTASGDYLYRESRRVFSYQPGKSMQIFQTFVLSPAKTNLRQRVGHFSTNNGTYLELDGSQLLIVQRTYSTGAVQETRVPQADWNVDKLDGSGPSDIVLDPSKTQILFLEYEWLGAGSVKVGFAIDGYFITAHQFNHANHIDRVYMTTATLPVRFEIENTGATSSSSTLKQICVSVISNGGYDKRTIPHIVSRSTPLTVGTADQPVVSIRMASGRTDSVIIPSGIAAIPTTADTFIIRMYKNATIVGGTWTLDPSGNVERNTTATSMSGGTVIGEYYVSGTNQATANLDIVDVANFQMQLGRTNASSVGGAVSDTFTLSAQVLSGTGDLVGSLSYYDLL
jgi:hypothetical protein